MKANLYYKNHALYDLPLYIYRFGKLIFISIQSGYLFCDFDFPILKNSCRILISPTPNRKFKYGTPFQMW